MAVMEPLAQITLLFEFEASHQLRRADWSDARNDAVFGNCARLHGHSYRLEVTLRGPVDAGTGMVRNFRDVKRAVRAAVVERLDHQHLNDLLGELSTAEHILLWIAGELRPLFAAELHRLVLWETRTACAVLERAELDTVREK